VSALDDLLARIEDPQLRADIAREIAPLRAEQELGLVFERHLPEATRLYGHPIRRGLSVQYRADDGGDTWQVVKVVDGQAQLRRTVDGEAHTEQAPAADLVVVRTFGEPIYPGLRSGGRVERGGDKPWHTVINAENYHALETLLYTCEGQVDAIYIDPPYNTGARDWKYDNDYVASDDDYRHSKWLAFMERRLKICRGLMRSDATLVVTIDEHEVNRLGVLLDQLFPESTRQLVTIVNNPKGVTQGYLSRVEEYAFFVFGPDARIGSVDDDLLTHRDMADAEGELQRPRWKGLLRSGDDSLRADRKDMFYPVWFDESTGRLSHAGEALPLDETPDFSPQDGLTPIWPIRRDMKEGRWGVGRSTLNSLIQQGFASLRRFDKKRGTWAVSYLSRQVRDDLSVGLLEVRNYDEVTGVADVVYVDTAARRIRTVWHRSSHDAGAHGTDLVGSLLGAGRTFPFPKSLYAVEDTLRPLVTGKPDAVVLDFFSGSGTTAHAVARLNKQDGGRRRSISVSNNEVSPDEAKTLRAAGLVPGDAEWEAQGIFEHITAPRIRAAITGQTPDGEPVKGDYKFTDEFPMSDGFDENVEFFTLTYEDPDVVRAGAAFAAVAPLLWLKAGAQGPRIDHNEGGWALPDGGRYGVLFSVDEWPDFTTAVNTAVDGGATVSHAFIVTNSDAQFQQAAAELPPETEPVRLYEDYLTSFTINAGGSL